MIAFRKAGTYLATGFVAQGAAAVAGLLLVRWIPAPQYAVYTVAVTLIGTISTLTRSGPSIGLSAALSLVWPDRARAAQALDAAMRMRWLVSAIVMPAVLVSAIWLFAKAGAGGTEIALFAVVLALIWLAEMQGGIIDQVLYFDGAANRVQALDTAIGLARMAMVVALKLTAQLGVLMALLTNLFSVAARVPFLTRWVGRALPAAPRDPADPEMRGAIRWTALQQVPIDLMTVLQAQLAIYFLTERAGLFELATYGALGRIAQLLGPFSALILAYFVPAFARHQDRIALRLAVFVALGMLPALALSAASWLAPGPILALIGSQYAGQAWPLLVCALTLVAMGAVNTLWSLVAHRGWNRWAWLRIPLGLGWAFAGPQVLALDSAASTYLFYCGFSLGTLVAALADLWGAQRRGEIGNLFRAEPAVPVAPDPL
jgi:hypothetical protein